MKPNNTKETVNETKGKIFLIKAPENEGVKYEFMGKGYVDLGKDSSGNTKYGDITLRLYRDNENSNNFIVYTRVPIYDKDLGKYVKKFIKTGTAELKESQNTNKPYLYFDNTVGFSFFEKEKYYSRRFEMKGFVNFLPEDKQGLFAVVEMSQKTQNYFPDFKVLNKEQNATPIKIETKNKDVVERVPEYTGIVKTYSQDKKEFELLKVALFSNNKGGKVLVTAEKDQEIYKVAEPGRFKIVTTAGNISIANVIEIKKEVKNEVKQEKAQQNEVEVEESNFVEETLEEQAEDPFVGDDIQENIDDMYEDDLFEADIDSSNQVPLL